MYNDLFSIGPLTFHTYGLMTGIGIVAAYLAAERLAKKRSLDFEQIFGLVISCLIFGYAGSKLLYILTVLPQLIVLCDGVIRKTTFRLDLSGGEEI